MVIVNTGRTALRPLGVNKPELQEGQVTQPLITTAREVPSFDRLIRRRRVTPQAEAARNDKWSMDCIYIALLSKALYSGLTFTHSHTDHATRQEQLGLSGVLLRDTSTLDLAEPGDRTSNLPVTRQPLLPPELLPPVMMTIGVLLQLVRENHHRQVVPVVSVIRIASVYGSIGPRCASN